MSRRRVARAGIWLIDFVTSLENEGFCIIGDDETLREQLTEHCGRFFAARDILVPGIYNGIVNQSKVPRHLQKKLAARYLQYKKEGATNYQLHELRTLLGVTSSKMYTWIRNHFGAGATRVGPFAVGQTKKVVLRALKKRKRGQSIKTLAELCDRKPATVRQSLYGLEREKRVRRKRIKDKSCPRGLRDIWYAR